MEKLDVVILGATGFSGKYIAKMFARINSGVKWGIAGRSPDKLKRLTAELKEIGEETTKLPVFICNANDKSSLIEACKRTKIIINCIGPYVTTGDAVVEACIESGTHYMDITIEMNYILNLSRKYHQLAEKANVLIIPACGLVAIITVMGLMHLEDQFSGTLKSVEIYNNLELPTEMLYPSSKNAIFHSSSLDTIIERIKNMGECEKSAREMLTEVEEPAELKRSYLHYRKGKIWAQYIFPDEPIAQMSQKYLNEVEGRRYIPCKMYISCTFSLFFLIALPFACLFYVLINFEWFRRLATKYPSFLTCGYITHEGPIEEVGKKVKCLFIYEGKGWSKDVKDFGLQANSAMTLKVTAYDGYQTTADAVVASTLTLLKESSKMPRGGVVNCGAAFRHTDIVQRLQEFGVEFKIIDK